MRKISLAYLGLGLFFLVLILASPAIVHWQAANAIAPYATPEYADHIAALWLDQALPLLIAGGAMNALIALSGLLMLYRRKGGFYLAVTLGVALLVVNMAELGVAAASRPADYSYWSAFISTLLWSPLLFATLSGNCKHGQAWWTSARTQLPAAP